MNKTIDMYSIENHFSKSGNFCLLDWLIANNYLEYTDYDRWRNGEIDVLDNCIKLNSGELETAVNSAEEFCRRLKLSASVKPYYQWNTEGGVQLNASRNRDLNKSLTQSWQRPQDLPQLDIFLDNSDVGTENDLRNALENRLFQRAKEKLRELGRINNSHPRLGVYQDLVNYGCHMEENPLVPKNGAEFLAQLSEEINGLEKEVEPLAREVLGSQARDYLAFAWRRLSDGLRNIPFDSEQPRVHQSHALEKIPDWAALKETLVDEPALFQQPVLLQRLANAHRQLGEKSLYLLLWCYLFEHHLVWASDIVEAREEPELYDLWEQFHDSDEEMDPVWFAGFILIKNRGLIHQLRHVGEFTHSSTLAVIDLLEMALKKDDEARVRQRLQQISRPLLTIYLNSR